MVARSTGYGKINRLIELKHLRTESEIIENFRQNVIVERELLRMSEVSGVKDSDLFQQLYAEGFRAESVLALSFYPVAMVAWASGSVSVEEATTAEEVVSRSELALSDDSIEQFRAWLQERPKGELWTLWEDFTLARRQAIGESKHNELSQVIVSVARTVATASGGVLGIGSICSEEQFLLDKIEATYRQTHMPTAIT